VFAANRIALNGILGLCLLLGGARHHAQGLQARGASAAPGVLTTIAVLCLVLPNFTRSEPGPVHVPVQLVFVALASLALYGMFLFVQMVRHPEDFRDPDRLGAAALAAPPTSRAFGVATAAVVLMPEALAAARAARQNRIQTSLNLTPGSALVSICLMIPVIALLSLVMEQPLVLGLEAERIVLLILSLFIATLTVVMGRTTVMQGGIHLVIFSAFLVIMAVP
jgi:Ca2+:H+ antiporter